MTKHSTLEAMLDELPPPLQFGTSGRRGLLRHLSQLEIYINALAELEYLKSLTKEEGGIVVGEPFFYAFDRRPSSSQIVEGSPPRGELAQAIEAAIRDAGMVPINLGQIPTPTLSAYALSQGKGSMMVTGSHIPFDRNGYKTNTSKGELLKHHEAPINDRVSEVRARLYAQAFVESPFGADGQFKDGSRPLMPQSPLAAEAYARRYIDFFGDDSLAGFRLALYEHSAVGRELLAEILQGLGAEVLKVGRSETFVPIDTENIDAEQLKAIQMLHDQRVRESGAVDAIVSTDGDSDRPLMLAVEQETGAVRFFGGDLVGMIAAEFLGADAIVVPISCNDAIDRGELREKLEPKTRIGSPYVIAGMEAAHAEGKRAIIGWEANGGFLTGSDIQRGNRCLKALPTRDAVLPIVAVLASAREKGLTLIELFSRLPKRYSRAALLKQFPRDRSLLIVDSFSPKRSSIADVDFHVTGARARDSRAISLELSAEDLADLEALKSRVEAFFDGPSGFTRIVGMNFVDGVRIRFENGDVAHLRPSGNADELRIYAVADSQSRANQIAESAIAEPDGIFRRIERQLLS